MSYWISQKRIKSREYICGYCGATISSEIGYYISQGDGFSKETGEGYIYICHKCFKPTYFDFCGNQVPGIIYGKSFKDEIFPDKNTADLYKEIQNCMKTGCYTSAVLLARKLLMHISVDCGANPDLKFFEYVDYLDQNGYISHNCKKWVDIIRKKGNEANHEIQLFNDNEAKQIIKFAEMMISVIYEMPYEASKFEDENN